MSNINIMEAGQLEEGPGLDLQLLLAIRNGNNDQPKERMLLRMLERLLSKRSSRIAQEQGELC